MAKKISIYIVEDDPLLGRLLSIALSRETDLRTIGSARTARDAIAGLGSLAPDVVILDLNLPDRSGYSVLDHIGLSRQRPKVLVLTVEQGAEAELRAARAGASGFLSKLRTVPDVAAAVRRAAAGHYWLSPGVVERLIREYPLLYRQDRTRRLTYGLTSRELQVLERLAAGRINREIASDLCLSLSTVKKAITGLLRRLGVPNRIDAVRIAINEGLTSDRPSDRAGRP